LIDDTILIFMNHPLVWLIIIAIPTAFILKLYLTHKFEFHKQKLKNQDTKINEMNTIAGKLGFAIKNPTLAYEKLHADIKECDQMIEKVKGNKEMTEVYESKKKNCEWQLQIVNGLMKNQTLIDFIGADTIIPVMSGVEKKLKGLVKKTIGSGFNI